MFKLSILVPVYNEEKTIEEILIRLNKVKLDCQKEIIVINDGSTDETGKIIDKLKLKIKNMKIVFHKKNLGKGTAIKNGIKKASGESILIQDADLEYNPEEIPKLILPLMRSKNKDWLKKKTVAIYGSRFKNGKAILPKLYLLGNKILTNLTNLLYGVNLTDMETGYKILPSKFLRQIKLNSCYFDIEPEITAKLIRNKIPIVEIPISYKGRNRLGGKKLTLVDSFGALKALLYYRFFL